jgi:predicted GIY-YIG superfamily endonuclease
MQHFVYVLKSLAQPNQFYVGLTTDPHVRLKERYAGKSAHTKNTSRGRSSIIAGSMNPPTPQIMSCI